MGDIRMSSKERKRLGVMVRVDAGELGLKDASRILGISYRHAKRVRKRYREEGDVGLVHRSKGRDSNRGIQEDTWSGVFGLYRGRYAGFGPTLFSEKLEEDHGVRIDHETLRRHLLEEGLWVKVRKGPKHRNWRQRKAHFGELVQIDGSFHDWFENGEKNCLMVMVDDATGRSMSLMGKEETTEAAMRLLWLWIERYGVPHALYADRKNVYITDREPTIEEELSGREPLTAFGRACSKLGIRIIPAYSPQAKGRVERKNGVYQDRLVKEFRLNGIKDNDAANRALSAFNEKLNNKFALCPADPADYHIPVPEGISLEDIFCWEESRVLSNDWTFRFETRLFQIEKQSDLPPAKTRVKVLKRLDGSMKVVYRNRPVIFKEIPSRPVQEPKKITKRKPWKPAPDHPWRNYQQHGAARGTVPLALTCNQTHQQGTFLSSQERGHF